MPIKRGKFKRRTRNSYALEKKKVAEAKKTTLKDISQDIKINKLMKITKHLRPEVKYFDAGNTSVGGIYRFYFTGDYAHNGYNYGVLTSFDLVPQGSGQNARIGNSITPKSFELNLELTKGSGDSNKYRIIVVQVGDVVTTTDYVWDILEYGVYANGGGASSALLSPYNKVPTIPYKVLYDKTFNIDTYKPGNHHRILIKNLSKIDYNGVSTSAIRGRICALMIDNSPNSTSGPSGDHIGYYWTSRLKYYDN